MSTSLNTSLLIDESLPNITGETGGWVGGNVAGDNGSLYTVQKANRGWGGSIESGVKSVALDASRSSSTYQDNAHVRPLSLVTSFLIRY